MTDVRERGVGYVPALAHKDPRSGFVALQQRLRHARVFHDHLADFMAAQCEAEEAYVKHLQKAAKRFGDPAHIPIEYRPVYACLVDQFGQLAQLHTVFARQLQRQHDMLHTAPAHGAWSALARHDEGMAPSIRELQSLELHLAKDQRKLEQKRTPAAQSKLDATQEALRRAQAAWQSRAPIALQAYEAADLERLTMLRDAAIHLAKDQSELARGLYDMARTTAQAAKAFDPRADMARFVGVQHAPHGIALPSEYMDASHRSQAAPAAIETPPQVGPREARPMPPPPAPTAIETPPAPHAPSQELPPAPPAPPQATPQEVPSAPPSAPRASHLSFLPPDDAAEMTRIREQLRQHARPSSSRRREFRASSYDVSEHAHHPIVSPIIGSPFTSPMTEAWHESAPATVPEREAAPAPVPIDVGVYERIHAVWRHGLLDQVRVVGEVRVSAPQQVRAVLRLAGDAGAQIHAAAGVTCTAPHVYELDVGDDTCALEYEVPLDHGDEVVPLLLQTQWRCEAQQSLVLVTHRPNPAVPPAVTAALQDVSFRISLPSDAHVTGGVMSEPIGDWDPATHTLSWHAHALEGRSAVRFPLATQGSPQDVHASWRLPAYTMSPLDVHVEAAGTPLAVAPMQRLTLAGRYQVVS